MWLFGMDREMWPLRERELGLGSHVMKHDNGGVEDKRENDVTLI